MTETDFAFWISLLISSIYGASNKIWQQVLWFMVAFVVLLIQTLDAEVGILP